MNDIKIKPEDVEFLSVDSDKKYISRRLFLGRMIKGTFSFALVPFYFSCKSKKSREQNSFHLPKFFDCNKYVGPGFPEKPDFPCVSDLLAHMDRIGIDRAVAWHTDARQLSPMAGNEKLLSEIEYAKARSRIIPSFIIVPSLIDDSKVIGRLLELIKTKNFRAFHYFPGRFGWVLSDISPVIEKIRNYNPVLFLNVRDANQDEILGFSNQFPELSIVLTDAMWGHYCIFLPNPDSNS